MPVAHDADSHIFQLGDGERVLGYSVSVPAAHHVDAQGRPSLRNVKRPLVYVHGFPTCRLESKMLRHAASRRFVGFLERLTGITPLLTDPTKSGGGIQASWKGGTLAMHADFNREMPSSKTGTRRVNTFVFLNEHWKDEYNGHLELWDRNLSECRQRILPSLGRFVVFLSTDFSYHGHPTPLMPPNGRLRRSLSTYYYSMSTPPASECVNGDCETRHEVLWKPLPDEVLGKECRRPPPA